MGVVVVRHGRRRRAGGRHVGVAVGVGGRRLRRAGAGRRARAVAVLPPRAAAVAAHQVRMRGARDPSDSWNIINLTYVSAILQYSYA